MALLSCVFMAALLLISSSSAAADSNSNPADELASILNNNRTAHNSTSLYDNPGLGCIALQYIKAYQGKCNLVSGPNAEKPADSDFAQTFAPNCGVDASSLTPITGRLLGCESNYLTPSHAFSELLIKNERSLTIIYDKNHTELGAAVSGSDGGSPYFWCILFSSGNSNSSFVVSSGEAKSQRPGCFSGTNDTCSSAVGLREIKGVQNTIFVGLFISLLFAFITL